MANDQKEPKSSGGFALRMSAAGVAIAAGSLILGAVSLNQSCDVDSRQNKLQQALTAPQVLASTVVTLAPHESGADVESQLFFTRARGRGVRFVGSFSKERVDEWQTEAKLAFMWLTVDVVAGAACAKPVSMEFSAEPPSSALVLEEPPSMPTGLVLCPEHGSMVVPIFSFTVPESVSYTISGAWRYLDEEVRFTGLDCSLKYVPTIPRDAGSETLDCNDAVQIREVSIYYGEYREQSPWD